MKKRTFLFDGNDRAGSALVNVIKTYIEAAHPRDGSDCSNATRHAFEELAKKITQSDNIEISTRQRPMLKSAINWYYTDVDCDKPTEHEMLLNKLKKLT